MHFSESDWPAGFIECIGLYIYITSVSLRHGEQ